MCYSIIMVMTLVPLFVSLFGLLAYLGSANSKMSEVGRLSFAVGLFWVLATLSNLGTVSLHH